MGRKKGDAVLEIFPASKGGEAKKGSVRHDESLRGIKPTPGKLGQVIERKGGPS